MSITQCQRHCDGECSSKSLLAGTFLLCYLYTQIVKWIWLDWIELNPLLSDDRAVRDYLFSLFNVPSEQNLSTNKTLWWCLCTETSSLTSLYCDLEISKWILSETDSRKKNFTDGSSVSFQTRSSHSTPPSVQKLERNVHNFELVYTVRYNQSNGKNKIELLYRKWNEAFHSWTRNQSSKELSERHSTAWKVHVKCILVFHSR